MSTVPFIHLRVHSEYSLEDSVVRLAPLMQRLKQQQMPAVALTDLSNMYAAIKFYKAATSAGIKPICGCDIYLAPDKDLPTTRMTLLVMDMAGYKNLIKLVSLGYQQGQQDGKPQIKKQWLSQHHQGLIALSGAQYGEIGHLLALRSQAVAGKALAAWLDIFTDRFYLEIQRTGREGDEACVEKTVALAQAFDVPLVATNDVMFLQEDEFDAHEARVCINQSMILDDPRRVTKYSSQQYLRSGEEMQVLFADLPSALANSVEIAKRCNLSLNLGVTYLPTFPVPEGTNENDYLRQLSFAGMEKRWQQASPSYSDEVRQQHLERLEFELDVIINMGFAGYFLIVMDFIRWAKENNIPVGPGRGSGVSSLVAYALSITDLEPLRYNFIFERFLNPERVSMPDFDIDFCMDKRDKVIEYVSNTYGQHAVSQIITFGTMAARAVIRDVARVQGKAFGLADTLSKMIPFKPGITLNEAFAAEPALDEFVRQNDEAAEIIEMAKKLEGLTRNIGKHAGGVVIAPTSLTDFAPLYCDQDGGNLVIQYDKDDAEKVGLVKFDFLGLRTLTLIDWAVTAVNERRQKQNLPPVRIENISLEDKAVYDMLSKGEAVGIFQLESDGMQGAMERLKPDCFEDIISILALYRPGPLSAGVVDTFINRKHGKAPLAWPEEDYQLDILKPELESTYGVILYQEQVMQIARVMANYSLGDADELRRAMGKKNMGAMIKHRDNFLLGSEANGIDRTLAGNIFDKVQTFAEYGFNKSHSGAYAFISYQAAWLKCHYPEQYMMAVLSSEMQDTEKCVHFVQECHRMQLPLHYPDVNSSLFKFSVNQKQAIVYGLGAVKGVGQGPVAAIAAARDIGGEFIDLFDLCQRVGTKYINKRVLGALIDAGACDQLIQPVDLGVAPVAAAENKLDWLRRGRKVLHTATQDALRAAEQNEHNQAVGMTDMFGATHVQHTNDQTNFYAPYQDITPFSSKALLQLEKNVLGMYITAHPINTYTKELKNFVPNAIADLQVSKYDDQLIAGLLINQRTVTTKTNKTLNFITLEDATGTIEAVLTSNIYQECRDTIHNYDVLIVKGKVQQDEYASRLKVTVKQIYSMPLMRALHARGLVINFNHDQVEDNVIKQMISLLEKYQITGDRPSNRIQINYQNGTSKGVLRCAYPWMVSIDDQLLYELDTLLGAEAVQVRY